MSDKIILPKKIVIAGFDITFEPLTHYEANEKHSWGEFAANQQKIRIDETIPTPYKLIDTLLHEIGHAIYWAYGIYDDDKEERIVSTFATAWMQVYRDNPWLLDYIGDKLHDKPETVNIAEFN